MNQPTNIEFPVTLKEAQQKRYGVTEKYPRGTSFDPNCCAMEIRENARCKTRYQCNRKPGRGPGKMYCDKHEKLATEALAALV